MDGLKNYREKIKSIEKLVNKMENGELSIHELVELEKLTGELHERSIILKYKAFENRTENSNSGQEKPNEKLVDQIQETEANSQVEITESDTADAEVEELKEETPVIDFSMFDQPEEVKEKPKSSIDHQINLMQSDLIEPVEEKIESVVEKEEPEVEPISEEEINVVVKENGTSFLDRLSIVDNSIGSQIGGQKLETLSGAFGINQRLLYINELFDGSGEAFSDAIKTLDTQPNLDAASDKVEELAFKNSWNPEEEVVLEFLAIIKRRYV